jgi:ribosomal subunit interface protein
MNIIIKGTNIKLTPSLRNYVEEKVGSLSKFLAEASGGIGAFGDESYEARVELARTTRHHRHGQVFKAEVNLVAEKGAEILRAVALKEDLRAAIDKVRDELARQLKKTKGKKTSVYLRQARAFKKSVSLSKLARWFRKGRIRREGM